MYADVGNQLIHLLRYFGTFVVLFYALPKLMFHRPEGDGLERAAALFLKMTLFVIATGYALVLLKLFEVLGLLAVYGLVAAHRTTKRWAAANERRMEHFTVGAFDLLEGKLPWKERMRAAAAAKAAAWKESARLGLRSVPKVWGIALLLVVFGAAAYIRMYDAVTTPTPALSDGNVTLEWMKHIDDRILFKSGVYPQGFHIFLDTIHKFASMDSLYVLKYTGPFNMLLVMLGMYLYVSRTTGNAAAGVLSAAVFGLLGGQFGGPLERQAATNSQEFAFVFVFPTLYFLHRFLKERRRDDLFVAGAGMAIVGLVHPVAFAFLGLGVAIAMAVFFLAQGRTSWKPLLGVSAAGAAAVGSAIVPLGVGLYVLRREFHSSSVEYLGERTTFAMPVLTSVDLAALATLAIASAALLLRIRSYRALTAEWIAFLVGVSAFALYYWGGVVTVNQVVATRSGELWGLALPVAVGFAAHLAAEPFLGGRRKTQLALLSAAVAALLVANPPTPIAPYKMTWDSSVDQYLRIKNEYRPRTWTIISKEDDYAIVYGSGFHFSTREFLANYDPQKFHLTKFGEDAPDKNVTNDVFLYVEKRIFRVEESNSIYPIKEPDYVRFEEEAARVERWVQLHKEAGHPVEVYYEDEVLKIYHLHREPTRQEVMETIWGS